MTNVHTTRGHTFGNYNIVVPTREDWEKNSSKYLRKWQVWFIDRILQINILSFWHTSIFTFADYEPIKVNK